MKYMYYQNMTFFFFLNSSFGRGMQSWPHTVAETLQDMRSVLMISGNFWAKWENAQEPATHQLCGHDNSRSEGQELQQ